MSNTHLEKIDKIASKINASPVVTKAQDFTIFTTDTGEKVKTSERICKGIINDLMFVRGTSTGIFYPDR